MGIGLLAAYTSIDFRVGKELAMYLHILLFIQLSFLWVLTGSFSLKSGRVLFIHLSVPVPEAIVGNVNE
jgi:hypothetical protein